MGSTERDILTRIKADLVGITGSDYNYDFSASDQVVIVQEQEPIRVPCIYINPITVGTRQTAGRTRLRNYDREFRVQVDAWVPTTSSAPGTTILAAMDVQSDVMKALESDRSLGSVGAHDVSIEASAYDGAELDLPGIGVATLLVTVTYSERSGA